MPPEEEDGAQGDFCHFPTLSSRRKPLGAIKIPKREAMLQLAKPLLSRSILIVVATLLSLIQIIGIPYDYGDYTRSIEQSLSARNVGIIAGFSIGYISPVMIDLLVDAYQGLYELWISRSCYFIFSVIYAVIILISPTTPQAGKIYLLYGSAAIIFFTGRAFVDLCINDPTKTWTVKRCIALLSILSIGQLLDNLSKASFSRNSRLEIIGPSISAFYAMLVLVTSFLCSFRVLRHYKGPTILIRLSRASHEESITVLISLTIGIASIAFLILPLISGSFKTQSSTAYSPAFICGDLMIRTYFVSTVALLPSVIMKHKAISLQNDLDLKSLFVRNVAHEIRYTFVILDIISTHRP